MQSQASDYLSRAKSDAVSKDALEAAKAMKKGNKDKKDRSAQGFKENLKRLLLPTSAAEIEEYKKSMRAAYVIYSKYLHRLTRTPSSYEAQQQQKNSSVVPASKSEDGVTVASAGQDALMLSSSTPASAMHEATQSQRSHLPVQPSGPPPDRRSKGYTQEQVSDSNKKEGEKEKEDKKEKKDKDRRSKSYTPDQTTEGAKKDEDKEDKKDKKDRRSKSYTPDQVAENSKKEDKKEKDSRRSRGEDVDAKVDLKPHVLQKQGSRGKLTDSRDGKDVTRYGLSDPPL